MKRAEEVIKVAGEITALRAQLAVLEATLDGLVGEGPKKTRQVRSRGSSKSRSSSSTIDGTLTEKIKKTLQSAPSKSWSVGTITNAVPEADEKSVRSTVSRLAKDADGVKRIARGRYQYATPKPKREPAFKEAAE